jgi:type II secretory pathway component PulM
MVLFGVDVLLLLVIVLVLLLQPASRPADRAQAAVSPLHHLAIMPAAWPVLGDRRITRIG